MDQLVMNKAKREQVALIARKIRDALHVGTPVDLESAIARLGGVVEYIEPGLEQPEASITREGDGGFVIRLARDKASVRQRFSLAHELGHLFLHMGFANPATWQRAGKFEESYNREGYGEQELEAHEFAAAFLMPEEEYRARVGTNESISAIAAHFGVSTEAALNRGRWLGVFDWPEAV